MRSLKRFVIASGLAFGALSAGCGGGPTYTEAVVSERPYVRKDVKLPGAYLTAGRQDGVGFRDCHDGNGCKDHLFYGTPEAIGTIAMRLLPGDKVRWPSNNNAVNGLELVEATKLESVPFERELTVEGVADLARYENLKNMSVDSVIASFEGVFRRDGMKAGVNAKLENRYPVEIVMGSYQGAANIINNLSAGHRTIIFPEPTDDGRGIKGGPLPLPVRTEYGTKFRASADSIKFVHREKYLLQGQTRDTVWGIGDPNGRHIYGQTEKPCSSHPGYMPACGPQAAPARPAPVKPAPKPAPTPVKPASAKPSTPPASPGKPAPKSGLNKDDCTDCGILANVKIYGEKILQEIGILKNDVADLKKYPKNP